MLEILMPNVLSLSILVQTLVQTADISLLDYVTSLLSDHLHFDLPSLFFSKTRARVILLKCIFNTLIYSLKPFHGLNLKIH